MEMVRAYGTGRIGSVHGVQVLRSSSRRESKIALGSSCSPKNSTLGAGEEEGSGRLGSCQETVSSSAKEPTLSGFPGSDNGEKIGEEYALGAAPGRWS
ncbi:hypothetical protein PUN28_016952 [Cardiocondyla obscurior]|uniref:Uncharacterized protein n=1 Tax=Cardiocondyla obscurior TaxID=286306 RepID=A0AAW2EJN7_9HYME